MILKKLNEVANFTFGHHISEIKTEGTKYLQVKNFDQNGRFLDNVENFIDTNILNKNHLLVQDDILLVGKGLKFFAYKYDSSIGEAVASSVFYVIKAKRNIVLPNFLECVLNQPKSLNYFYGISAGSSIPSIRKSELANFEFNLPSLEIQKKIADIYQLHQKEIILLDKMKELKQNMFNQIINEILK